MIIAVIGGGIVGLTLTRSLANKFPHAKIDLFDKGGLPPVGPSVNNSGVLHAGLYYKPNSLKAKLCIRGGSLLKSYLYDNKLPILNSGKLLVPQDDKDIDRIEKIHSNSKENLVLTRLIEYQEASAVQRGIVKKDIYLYSPNTCVFNPKSIVNRLISEISNKHVYKYLQEVYYIDGDTGFLYTSKGKSKYDLIFNVAGPGSLPLYERDFSARFEYALLPFLGQYGCLISDKNIISTNIYPVPDPSLPFLGVHLTPRPGKTTIIGPNAIPYPLRYINSIEKSDLLSIIPRLFYNTLLFVSNKRRFREHAISELTFDIRDKFVKRTNSFLDKTHQITSKDVVMDSSIYALRAQLVKISNLEFVDDFLLKTKKHSVHLVNAVSPAFTSSFAIAEHLSSLDYL